MRFPQKDSYASALSVSSSTMVSPTLPTPPKRDLSSSPSSSVKLKIRVDNRSQSAEIMKEINKISTSFPKYVSKCFDKSLEILTESYSQATEAKSKLLEKMDNLDISDPVFCNVKHYNIVGLHYEVSKEEVVASFIRDNPKLNLEKSNHDQLSVKVKGLDHAVLTVKSVNRCHSGVYRVCVAVTTEFCHSGQL